MTVDRRFLSRHASSIECNFQLCSFSAICPALYFIACCNSHAALTLLYFSLYIRCLVSIKDTCLHASVCMVDCSIQFASAHVFEIPWYSVVRENSTIKRDLPVG